MTEAVATEAPATETAAAAPESLLHTPATDAPAEATATPEAPADAFQFADKVLAKTADGATDWEQTARRAEQARQHLERRLHTGEAPPKDVSGYAFEPPADLKDFELKGERIEGFKAEALKHGITPAQFGWMMESYLKAVPDLMEGAAKMSAKQAGEELTKVWGPQFDANLSAAKKTIAAMPAELQEATAAYGTDPVFIRVAAWIGAQLGEDRAPSNVAGMAGGDSPEVLMASEAYRNPRHPEHQIMSERVRRAFAARPGANQPL